MHVACVTLVIALSAFVPATLTAQPAKTTKVERALANLQTLHREAHQLFANDLERVGDHAVTGCEQRRGLLFPRRSAERPPVNEDDRGTRALVFVVELDRS